MSWPWSSGSCRVTLPGRDAALAGLPNDEHAVAARDQLAEVSGVGPVIAATVIGDVITVARFPSRDHFAACNGTAPAGVSSGQQEIHRRRCATVGASTMPSIWPRSPRSGTSDGTCSERIGRGLSLAADLGLPRHDRAHTAEPATCSLGPSLPSGSRAVAATGPEFRAADLRFAVAEARELLVAAASRRNRRSPAWPPDPFRVW